MLHLREVRTFEPVFGPEDRFRDLMFAKVSPDFRRLAVCGRTPPTTVWDLETGEQIQRLEADSASALFSPDGATLMVSEKNDARLWDLTSGLQIARFNAHQDEITCMAFSPQGDVVVTGSGLMILDLIHRSIFYDLAERLGLTRFTRDYSVRLWDPASGKQICRLARGAFPIDQVAFSPDGSSVAYADHGSYLSVVERHSGRITWRVRLWAIRPFLPCPALLPTVKHLAFSTDGQKILCIDSHGVFRVFRLDRFGHEDYAPCNEDKGFSACADRAMSRDSDGLVRLWDLETGREIGRFSVDAEHYPDFGISALSRDGRKLLFQTKGAIKVRLGILE